jgi:glucokinase
VDLGDLEGVALGAPGPLDSKAGVILDAPNLGWRDVPLASMVAKQLNLPVKLENDAHCAAWGEFSFGAGRGYSDAVIVTLGTGVGGGLILGGRLLRGPDGSAGHVGHMVLDPNGPTDARGNAGSVEAMCSATA